MVRRNDVVFLGGDFNMALFRVVDELRHYGISATFLGSFAWCKPRGSDAASSTSRASPAMAGDKFPGVYFDSLGLFALQPIQDLKRLHNLGNLRLDAALPPGAHLREFLKAEGYSERSYLGRGEAIEAAFRSDTRGGGVEWPRATLPMVKQKALIPEVWDATNTLRGHGAHMPLLFYVGKRGFRSTERLKQREVNMTARGWGPGSPNRIRHMQGLGKGKDNDKGKGDQGKDDTKGCSNM